MQNEQEDELLDYNEDPDCAGNNGSGQHMSNTPVQSPMSLVSNENEGEEGGEDRNDLEEGQEPERDTKSAELARIEQRQREFDTLSTRLTENGW